MGERVVSGQALHGRFTPSRPRARLPSRLSPLLRDAAGLLAAWDMMVVLLTGLACRQLNPAARAAMTPRELLVIGGTAALVAAVLGRRGFSSGAGARAGFALVIPVLHAFGLMLLALLLWDGVTGLWQGAAPQVPAPDAILANRDWLFAWTIAAPVALLLSRDAVGAAVLRRGTGRPARRAILIGHGDRAARVAAYLAAKEAVQIVGFLGVGPGAGAATPEDAAPAAGWPVLRGLRAARALIQAGDADLVIIALPEAASQRTRAILRRMSGIAVDVRLAPDTMRFYRPDARVSSIGGLPFLHLSDKPMGARAAAVKRAEDLALGLPLLCVAAPLMLLVAMLIRWDSPGPALFIQPRLGFNNRVIQVRKFRTMHGTQADERGCRQTVRDDPRVTRLGRWLRRTSLDELPQLINVVGGSMSLVGPRPHALGTEAAGQPFAMAAADYAARHRVKPGMTGWAQVRGWRGETDTVEKLRRRVEHDLHYIARWSLRFDLRILAMTLRAVVRAVARGEAY